MTDVSINLNKNRTRQGSLICFEGLDGSGKTVTSLTVQEMLEAMGHSVRYISFPQYDSSFFGPILKEVLYRDDIVDIDPKLLTFLFAGDRFEAKDKIQHWLDEGNVVIANRYVTSNIAYGMAKSKNREEFKKFNENLEYITCNIPKPDFVMYLDTPLEVIKERLQAKDQDGYEKNISFLENVRECYLDLVKTNDSWKNISTIDTSKGLDEKNLPAILEPTDIAKIIIETHLKSL